MNDNSTKQQLIIRWMDGEVMTPEELEALEEIDKVSPEDVLDPTEFSLIRRQMKEAFALDADIPNGDLFATLLESRICREERESKEKEVLHGKVVHLTDENSHLSHSLNKIQWIPMIASAAACLVLGLIVGKSFLGESSEAEVVKVVSPPSLTPVVYPVDDTLSINFLREKQCNVIVVEGLEALPEDFDLFKYSNKVEVIKVHPNTDYQTH